MMNIIMLLASLVFHFVPCVSDADCNDNITTTEDICLIDGQCTHLPACSTNQDCNDNNDCTRDLCILNKCYEFPNCPYPRSADLNGNGVVDDPDLATLLGDWGKPALDPADINLDGFVDSADLALMLGKWGTIGYDTGT